jgi:PAS domain S-box-containing protein
VLGRAQVLKVADAVASAEEQFAATMDRLAESQPRYADHLHALSSQARKQMAAERRWAASHALLTSLAGRSPSTAGGAEAGSVRQPAGPGPLAPELIWSLADAFPDAVALTDCDGVITLASRRLAELFGYERAELIGCPVEKLVPAASRAAHRDHRAAYAQAPRIKQRDDRARFAGLRKDGSTVLIEISLSPVKTDAGPYTLAVIREAPEPWAREDFPELAKAAAASDEHRRQEMILLGQVVNDLFKTGFSLRDAMSKPGRVLAERATEAVQVLDDTIGQVREHVLSAHRGETPRRNPVTRDRLD